MSVYAGIEGCAAGGEWRKGDFTHVQRAGVRRGATKTVCGLYDASGARIASSQGPCSNPWVRLAARAAVRKRF